MAEFTTAKEIFQEFSRDLVSTNVIKLILETGSTYWYSTPLNKKATNFKITISGIEENV